MKKIHLGFDGKLLVAVVMSIVAWVLLATARDAVYGHEPFWYVLLLATSLNWLVYFIFRFVIKAFRELDKEIDEGGFWM